MSHRCAMHAPRNRFGSGETPALYSTGTPPKEAATADLRTPLQFLKGVGPRRAAQLERKGLRTVEDALFFLPLRHEDRTRLVPFRSLQPGQVATCSGTIVGLSPPPPGRSRAPLVVMLRDESGYAQASWFHGAYLARVFERGQRLVLHGKVTRFKGAVVIQQPDYEIVESGDDERLHTGRLVPVYSLTEGLAPRAPPALPWPLTGAQERVWNEIRRDMAAPFPMHRLLQGDVGSGKTIVAALAVLTAIEAGYQAAVMAPTEILAEQHVFTFRQLLEPLGVPVTLLTSSLKPRERAARRAGIAAGDVACVVGTHALVQEGVEFRRLGLAVVDEQHRFGVEQRARLRGKGEHPDLLVMTATPIPRTLALTLYGDLDVSVLDELPPGRRPVVTVARTESKRREIYAFLRDEIGRGRQAYVVYPLVEESEALDLKAATDMARHLAEDVFPDLTVGLMHGRLGFEAKDAIMRRFKAGEIHILVSTTVIEVGIDVPNASVMLVEHGERFGLSQLHQLRGRVGRGPWKSYCILLTGGRLAPEAERRIGAMVETNDGFKIAEVDLELRGPGEFFGTRQSGLPEFRTADLLRDGAILEEARQEAQAIIAADRELRDPAHGGLRASLLARWRGKLALASAG